MNKFYKKEYDKYYFRFDESECVVPMILCSLLDTTEPNPKLIHSYILAKHDFKDGRIIILEDYLFEDKSYHE